MSQQRVFGLGLCVLALLLFGVNANPVKADEEAKATVRRLGGAIAVDKIDKRPVVDLAFKYVDDTELASIARWVEIKRLSLFYTLVTRRGIPHLSKLASITQLDLSGTSVDSDALKHLKGLTKIEVLDLGSTRVMGKGLKYLRESNLKSLNLSGTDTRNLQYVGQLGGLEKLDLGRTHITDKSLEQLTRRKMCRPVLMAGVAGGPCTGALHAAAAASLLEYFPARLKKLVLRGDTNITDAGLKHLTALRELHTLDLRDTDIGDAGLEYVAKLSTLKTLDLTDTEITDSGLQHLASMPHLEILYVEKTEVTNDGIREFQKRRREKGFGKVEFRGK